MGGVAPRHMPAHSLTAVGAVRLADRILADMRHPMADLTVQFGWSPSQPMHVMFRLPLLPGLLLLAGAQLALAESPLPDPVAPAVIGRPLDEIKPVRPKRQKPAAAKAELSKQAAASPATATKVVRQPASAQQALASDAPATRHPAKQAVDDRADPRMRVDDVGKGTHLARKPLGPGAYFGDKHRTAVRKYYQDHPAPGAAAKWQVGEPVPRGAPLTAVPKGLLSSLPELPPGYRYIQLGGEVVLIAAESKLVVDGISRSRR